jgi:hypothetical protein
MALNLRKERLLALFADKQSGAIHGSSLSEHSANALRLLKS